MSDGRAASPLLKHDQFTGQPYIKLQVTAHRSLPCVTHHMSLPNDVGEEKVHHHRPQVPRHVRLLRRRAADRQSKVRVRLGCITGLQRASLTNPENATRGRSCDRDDICTRCSLIETTAPGRNYGS